MFAAAAQGWRGSGYLNMIGREHGQHKVMVAPGGLDTPVSRAFEQYTVNGAAGTRK